MELWVREIRTDVAVYQEITVTEPKHLNIEAIRAHLVKYNNPTGFIEAQIRDSNDKIIARSGTYNVQNLLPSDEAYTHGMVQFAIKAHLKYGGIYRIAVMPSGYAYSENSFMGISNGFDYGNGLESYDGSEGISAALHFELWSMDQVYRSAI